MPQFKSRLVAKELASVLVSDKMREKRNLGLRKLKTIGLANATIAVITIGIGVGILIVSSRGKTGWPVFNFGPIVCGLIVSTLKTFVITGPQIRVRM